MSNRDFFNELEKIRYETEEKTNDYVNHVFDKIEEKLNETTSGDC